MVGPPPYIRKLEEDPVEPSEEDARDFDALDEQEPDELRGDYFGTGEGDS
jgi:hypothetical protein